MGSAQSDRNNRVIATNRRARHDFLIEETFEAGLVLQGSEVKSLRAGTVTLRDGHVGEIDHELYLIAVHIGEYPFANLRNHEPRRPRKLLLNRREITKIRKRIQEKGYSCIPLKMLFKRGKVKVTLGLAKGKRQIDRRQDLKQRDAKRDMERGLKGS
jgi:SsrA-binding protein